MDTIAVFTSSQIFTIPLSHQKVADFKDQLLLNLVLKFNLSHRVLSHQSTFMLSIFPYFILRS